MADKDRTRKKNSPLPDDADDAEEEAPRKRKKGGAVVPFRNWPALTAYYLGILGLIPCVVGPLGLFDVIVRTAGYIAGPLGLFGILPIALGIFGFIKAHKDEQARGRIHAGIGIFLGLIELFVGCGSAAYLGYVFLGKN
jgi:hypothetical protein